MNEEEVRKKLFCPKVSAEAVAAFFRETASNAPELAGTEFPKFVRRRGARIMNQIDIELLDETWWRECRRLPELDSNGDPSKKPLGDYVVVDAANVSNIKYTSSRGSSRVRFIHDLDDHTFLVTVDTGNLGEVVAERLERHFQPLAEWKAY